MKNKLITRFGFVLVLCCFSIWAQAQQTANVGEIKNGVGILGDLKTAIKVLKANLSTTAEVSDVKIEIDPFEGKYYLTSSVTNDPASAIGIQLHVKGNILYAMAGPGVEITCNGYKCADCKLVFSYPRGRCKCYDTSMAPDTRCDMSQKITIGL